MSDTALISAIVVENLRKNGSGRPLMDKHIDWDGERLNPSNSNIDSAANHIIRYQFAKPYLKGAVLDAACGAGYGTYLLSKDFDGTVHGIDIEKSAITWASEFYSDQRNLEFSTRDIYSMGFEDETFDVVTSFETLEHLPELDGYFSELKRVTKNGGLIVFSVPDYTTNNGAGNLNKYHLNELTFAQFKSYLDHYFSDQSYFVQVIAKPSLKSKFLSYAASFLPIKLKARVKQVLASASQETRFDGRNFVELESAHGRLFHQYRVRSIDEYTSPDRLSSDSRFVFLAVVRV